MYREASVSGCSPRVHSWLCIYTILLLCLLEDRTGWMHSPPCFLPHPEPWVSHRPRESPIKEVLAVPPLAAHTQIHLCLLTSSWEEGFGYYERRERTGDDLKEKGRGS